MKKTMMLFLIAVLLVLFSVGTASADPAVTLDPTYAQRHFHNQGVKEKIRVHIKLSGAVDLLNFSIKVNYDPGKLEVVEFHHNETDWDYVQTGYFKDHDLYMFGASSTPISGDVLLGWLVVEHQGGINNTPAFGEITVQLARETSADPPFDNFVTSTPATLDELVDFSGALAAICIPNHFDVDACQGDFDGNADVDQDDYNRFYAAYPSTYPDADYDPAADLDADGDVDIDDKTMFDEDYNRTLPCPVCGGHEIVTSHDEIGGDIYPGPPTLEDGHVSVADGANYTFNILPDPNYSVSDVLVDGVSHLASCTKTGADYSYTFTNVTVDHTLQATFCELPGDIDGDKEVTSNDFRLFRGAYGSQEGDANFDPRADLDGDAQITSNDFRMFRTYYGSSCP